MVDTWVSSWLGGHKHGNSGNGATQRTHVTFQRFPSQFTNGMWFEADLRRSAAVGQGWLALYRVVTFAFFCYRCTMMYIYFASCPQSFLAQHFAIATITKIFVMDWISNAKINGSFHFCGVFHGPGLQFETWWDFTLGKVAQRAKFFSDVLLARRFW